MGEEHTNKKTYLGKVMGFPKYIQCYFLEESNANWKLLLITTSTRYTKYYKSVIFDFAVCALGGTILEI